MFGVYHEVYKAVTSRVPLENMDVLITIWQDREDRMTRGAVTPVSSLVDLADAQA